MELRDRFTDMREMDLQVQSKFDVLYQIRKTVFQHISKHKEES